ncbi:hypothetical protein [Cryobacterium psychrotolerans]|uniref:hypothetical protein n=1 Tax=Cryobacterium psychrotolerans TaxID=386301 RepID=UPI000B83BDCA|nr:hypothetical protein [Cryobacterium psychrotolerans]TFD86406.1 hypothetical protein E3T56_07430 [Cryobacterium psychrotolerans]
MFAPLVSPFENYHDVFWEVEDEPDPGLTSKTRMLALPAVSLATLRYRAAPADCMHPQTRGTVTEASMRLAKWKDNNARLSAWEVARNFQMLYFRGALSRSTRVPLLGLDLIRATDELGCEGLEWYVDVPREDDPFRFRIVRLKDALERFAPTVER